MPRLAAATLLLALVSPAAAQAPALPAPTPLWRVEIAAPEGWTAAFDQAVAVRPDGAALIVATFEGKAEKQGDTPPRRHEFVGVDAGGRIVWRHALPGAAASKTGFSAVVAALGRGEEYVAIWSDQRQALVLRVGAGGVAPIGGPTLTPALRRLGKNESEEFSIVEIVPAPDGRYAVYGGVDIGPQAPWVAVLDPGARLAWEFRGRHAMPPGGVARARFAAGGAVETITVDREEPFFERRNAAGQLTRRVKITAGPSFCMNFVGAAIAGIAFSRGEAPPRAVVMDLAGKPRGAVALPKVAEPTGSCLVAPVAGDVAFLAETRSPRALYLDAAGRPRGGVDLAPVAVAEFDAVVVAGRHLARIGRADGLAALPVALFRLPDPAPAAK